MSAAAWLGSPFLDEDFEQALEAECQACRYSDFPFVAAKFRSAAVQLAQPQAA